MNIVGASAIVTGAASGLGAATAGALAAAGVEVFGLDLPAQLEGIRPVEGVTYLAGDVTSETDVQTAVATAAARATLRTVVNCAGIAPSMRIVGRNGAHDLTTFLNVIRVNLVGTFTVMSIGAEAMIQTSPDESGQRGVIVNTASIAAFDGQVGQAAYAASKSGVVGLTLPAARDLAQHGIRVCTIAPGLVDTPMMQTISEEFRHALADGIPFPRRFAAPKEFAQLVQMIIDHDYLNGETIRMDGALRMTPR